MLITSGEKTTITIAIDTLLWSFHFTGTGRRPILNHLPFFKKGTWGTQEQELRNLLARADSVEQITWVLNGELF